MKTDFRISQLRAKSSFINIIICVKTMKMVHIIITNTPLKTIIVVIVIALEKRLSDIQHKTKSLSYQKKNNKWLGLTINFTVLFTHFWTLTS